MNGWEDTVSIIIIMHKYFEFTCAYRVMIVYSNYGHWYDAHDSPWIIEYYITAICGPLNTKGHLYVTLQYITEWLTLATAGNHYNPNPADHMTDVLWLGYFDGLA